MTRTATMRTQQRPKSTTQITQWLRAIVTSILILIVLVIGPLRAAHAAPLESPRDQQVKITEYRLRIPALKLDRPVVKAPFSGNTWAFGRLRWNAGYLEGRPLPGSGNNVALGAHVTLAKMTAGPFLKLSTLKAGDEVFVKFNGKEFRYVVEKQWETVPTDSEPIAQAGSEMLTLFTCSGYNPKGGTYETRLIVRATYSP